MESNLPDRMLNYAEAAHFLGLSENTLRRKVATNSIPFIRYSRKATRFRLSELSAWADSHRTDVPSKKVG